MSMLALEQEKETGGWSGNLDLQHTADPATVLEELFSLLEDYGPSWYTEEHHKRAVAALLAH